MKKIFICFPLNHEDVSIRDIRIAKAKEYCRSLLSDGYAPFSPALFGLAIKDEGQDILFSTWEHFCYSYLEPSDEVHVLKMNGWVTSKGVAGEVQKAKELGKPINYIDL